MLDFEQTQLEGVWGPIRTSFHARGSLRAKASKKPLVRARLKTFARVKSPTAAGAIDDAIARVHAKGIRAKVADTARVASTKPATARLGIRGKIAGSVAQVAAKPSEPVREAIAANLALKAVESIAKKPHLHKQHPPHVARHKAHKAIAPIARTCGCKPQKVIIRIEHALGRKGYPPATVSHLLAQLHDMNRALEKAALQRLATYEHRKLSAEKRFEHEVLSQLARISANLPECHPSRVRAFVKVAKGI